MLSTRPRLDPSARQHFRSDEHRLAIKSRGRQWSFDGDGALLRLVTEANRIKLAHLFDPCLAIHTSDWRQGPATDGGRRLPHQNGENCRSEEASRLLGVGSLLTGGEDPNPGRDSDCLRQRHGNPGGMGALILLPTEVH